MADEPLTPNRADPTDYAPIYLDGGNDPTFDQIDGFLYRHFNARAVHIDDLAALRSSESDSGIDDLRALFAEPHHLGFALSGRTGTYDTESVLIKRDWYERLRARLSTPDRADQRAALTNALAILDQRGGYGWTDAANILRDALATPDRADSSFRGVRGGDDDPDQYEPIEAATSDRADLVPHDHEALGCEYPCSVVAGTLEPR